MDNELRNSILAFYNPVKPEAERRVQTGVDTTGMSADQIDKLNSSYIKSILAKPGHEVSASERADLQADIARCLREDGYR